MCNFDSEDDNDDIVVETYLSNSCNSSTYSLNNYSIKLEPLLIEEDNKQDKKSTTSLSVSKETFEIKVDIVDTDSFNTTLPEAVPALPPQTTTEQQQQQTTATNVTNENSTNTFSCSSLNTNSESNLSSSLAVEPAVQPQTINNNNNSDSNCLNRLDEAAASLNERLKCETNKYSEEDEINQRQNQNSTEDDSLVDVDCLPQSPQSALETTARSINNEIVKAAAAAAEEEDDDEDKSSSTISDLSNTKIKDNYEKAKRERQLEQEQAELEKKRLQEILDICMEFQRQEQSKTELSSTTTNNKHRQNQNLNIRPPNLGSLKQLKTPGNLAVHTKNDKKSVNKMNQIEENGLSPSSSSSSSTASDSSSSINTNKLLNVINNVDLYNCNNDKSKINKLRSVSNGPFVLSNSIKNGNNGINSNSDVINKFFLLFF